MKKINGLLITFLLLLAAIQMQAQQKYAVLVGINKYYDRPGVQHTGSVLKGCVNDALAMKSMLKQKFGFSEDHIHALLDDNATKKNVSDALNDVLARSKPGDAVVFYFSGHGVWMTNLDQEKRELVLKKGYNQAMVMSDLYADKLSCLFTDAEVKRLFNKFVDKKVVSTAILDCCFSGMIPATFVMDLHNPYEWDLPKHSPERSLSFSDIFYTYEDYVLDPTEDISPDSLHKILAIQFPDTATEKSFNIKDALFIHDSSDITRPSERPGSMFLSLAATDDRTKGLDIADETGTPHGAYTCALLHVLRDNPANMPVAELLRKTSNLIKKQGYPFTMSFHDNARLSLNFIGIKPEGFKDHISASCTAIKGRTITLNAGLLDGLAVGNTLQAKNRAAFTVTAAALNSAEAIPVNASTTLIKIGDELTQVNSFTKSAPIIKVFFKGSDLSPAAFNKLMAQDILPLTKLQGYHDYENWDKGLSRNLFFYGDMLEGAKQTAISLRIPTLEDSFQVFLPIPSVVTNELAALLKKNRNIEVVNDPAAAELVLYLNYIKPSPGTKPHYVLTWANLNGADVNLPGMLSLYKANVIIADPYMDRAQAKALAVKIQDMLIPRIRNHTDRWLNEWPE